MTPSSAYFTLSVVKSKAKSTQSEMLFVRVSAGTLEALDARAAMATMGEGDADHVPRKVTRSDVARWLIERGLKTPPQPK